MDLSTTLLRERFQISDKKLESEQPLVATSNRLVLPLLNRRGETSEVLVIRAQTMHNCIRMAAALLQSFLRSGPLMARAAPFDYAGAWDMICSSHDLHFNPSRWVSLYSEGKCIFEMGERHPFLDVIEKCDSKNPGNYDRSVQIAEETFLKMGRTVSIQHTSNIGMVINVKATEVARCGLILRNPHKTTTFNLTIDADKERGISPVSCLNVSAAFLEGIQAAVRVGMINEKLKSNKIDRSHPEVKEARSALDRIAELNFEIHNFENTNLVRYRPEKPEFSVIVEEAERFQRQLGQ